MAVPGEQFFKAGLSLFLDDNMTSDLQQAAAQTEAATESMEDSAQDVSQSTAGMSAAAASTSTMASQAAITAERVDALSDRMNSLGSSYRSVGRSAVEASERMAIASGAVLTPLAGAVFQAARFESALVEVQKVGSEALAEGLARPLERMSMRIPLASTELVGLAADARRFGVTGEDNILRFVEATAKMSTATQLSTDEAGQAFAKLAALTNTPISQVENLGSAINALSNNFATDSQEIVDSMLRSSGALRQLNISGQQAAALSASLNEVSASAERAGTRLVRLVSEIQTPDTVKELSSLMGVTVQQFRSMRENSPTGLMLRLAEMMRSGSQAGRQLRATLSETSTKTLVRLGQNMDRVRKAMGLSNEAFNENTSLQREFQAALGTTAKQARLAWNQIQNTARLLGRELLPAVKAGIQDVRDFLGPLNTWIRTNSQLAKQIALTTAVVGGLGLALAGVTATFGFMAQGIGLALSAFGSFLGLFTGGGVVAGALTSVASAIGGIVTAAGSLVGGGAIAGLGVLAGVGALIFKAWRPLAAFFSGLFEGLWSAVQPLVPAFTGLFSALSPIADLFQWLITPLGSSVSEFQSFAAAGRIVGSVIGTFVTAPLKAMIGLVESAVRFWSELVSGIISFGAQIAQGNFVEAGKALINGFVRGIKQATSTLWDTMEGVAGGVREYLPFSPARRGPLSDLDKVGPAMMQTIAAGIQPGPVQSQLGTALPGPSASGRGAGVPSGGMMIRAPVDITINAGNQNVAQEAEEGVQRGLDAFEQKLNRVLNRSNRRSF